MRGDFGKAMRHLLWLLAWVGATWWSPASAQTVNILPNAMTQFVDGNGAPYAGGHVYMYIPFTTTPKATYQDPLAHTPNQNPITLDANGRAIIWGSGEYRQVLQDVYGVVQWDQLTYTSPATVPGTIGAIWYGTSSGTANAITLTGPGFNAQDGQQIGFVASTTNTGSATINASGYGSVLAQKTSSSGLTPLSGGEISTGNVEYATYVAAIHSFVLTTYTTPASDLGFAVGAGTIQLTSGGTGYAVGDSITANTSPTTLWLTYPVFTVNAVSAGVITGITLTNPGVTATSLTTNVTFVQSTTTGSGSGASFTGVLGPIAANLSFASIGTGGTNTNGNQFMGFDTPNALYGGSEGVFVGPYAGLAFVGSNFGNTALGEDAGGGDQGAFSNTGPGGNTTLGNDAGRNMNGTGGQSTLLGQNAGRGDDSLGYTGNQNTYVGNGSGQHNTTGSTNVGVGVTTLNAITSGINNTAVGAYSLSNNTTGSTNTALGRFALTTLANGGANTAIGTNSQSNATGSSNTSIGAGSLTFVTGGYNTALGLNAGATVTSGTNNVIIGSGVASTTLTTGNNNVLMGTTSACDTATATEHDTFRLCETSGGNYALTAPLVAGQSGIVIRNYSVLGGLPTCNPATTGLLVEVTDANSAGYNNILAGGGAQVILALCDGAKWREH